jgi:SAM-dependent methyltransferase
VREWRVEGGVIELWDSEVRVFRDTVDHWENGVCRLLGLDGPTAGRAWVEAVATKLVGLGRDTLEMLPDDDVVRILQASWEEVSSRRVSDSLAEPPTVPAPILTKPVYDEIFACPLADDDRLAVVGSRVDDLAWLIDRWTGAAPERATEYEDAYFEGGVQGLGYGSYRNQQPWRLEKAGRYVRQVEGLRRYCGAPPHSTPSLLDVGCGYGYFRWAAGEAGWAHRGVEVSGFAASAAQDMFGFDSFVGELEEFAATGPGDYDVITMWDVLEHVQDPVAFLELARSLLTPAGQLFVRTPNLAALEREVFGAEYHSFKAEHLWYFGPRGLTTALHAAGLSTRFMTTEAHLLQGFLGSRVSSFGARLLGSDFLVVASAAER